MPILEKLGKVFHIYGMRGVRNIWVMPILGFAQKIIKRDDLLKKRSRVFEMVRGRVKHLGILVNCFVDTYYLQ